MRIENNHTLQTVNTEFETTASSFSKIVTNICSTRVQCKHKQNHMET